jgi:hypothetical protein
MQVSHQPADGASLVFAVVGVSNACGTERSPATESPSQPTSASGVPPSRHLAGQIRSSAGREASAPPRPATRCDDHGSAAAQHSRHERNDRWACDRWIRSWRAGDAAQRRQWRRLPVMVDALYIAGRRIPDEAAGLPALANQPPPGPRAWTGRLRCSCCRRSNGTSTSSPLRLVVRAAAAVWTLLLPDDSMQA